MHGFKGKKKFKIGLQAVASNYALFSFRCYTKNGEISACLCTKLRAEQLLPDLSKKSKTPPARHL
jgi:hypothetical protein